MPLERLTKKCEQCGPTGGFILYRLSILARIAQWFMIKPYFRRHARQCVRKTRPTGDSAGVPRNERSEFWEFTCSAPTKIIGYTVGAIHESPALKAQNIRVPKKINFLHYRHAFHFRLELDGSLPISAVNFAEQNLKTKAAVRRRFSRGQTAVYLRFCLHSLSAQAARLSASFGAFLSDKEKHAIIGAKGAANVSPHAATETCAEKVSLCRKKSQRRNLKTCADGILRYLVALYFLLTMVFSLFNIEFAATIPRTRKSG